MVTVTLNRKNLLQSVRNLLHDGQDEVSVYNLLIQEGFGDNEAEAVVMKASELNQQKENDMIKAKKPDQNILADILSRLLVGGIIYGLPVMLFLFGTVYIYGRLATDMSEGIRSLAAAILPLVGTLAFYKSQARREAIDFLGRNKIVSFGTSFVMAMFAAGIASFLANTQFSGIPVGELIFSTTLALMVFGTDSSDEVSFLHVGAVSGFLSYIIIFGLEFTLFA